MEDSLSIFISNKTIQSYDNKDDAVVEMQPHKSNQKGNFIEISMHECKTHHH